MFVRRLYGKYILPKAEHLKKRVEEVKSGRYERMLEELRDKSVEELKKLYTEREREPDLSEPGKWLPDDKEHL